MAKRRIYQNRLMGKLVVTRPRVSPQEALKRLGDVLQPYVEELGGADAYLKHMQEYSIDDDIFDRTFGIWADQPDHLEELRKANLASLEALYGDEHMDMNDYQAEASTTAHYPHEQGVVYTALGLAGEAGEIANKVKKVIRGDKSVSEYREDLASELGDVLWYVAMLARELDYSLEDIASMNVAKLKDRQARNTIKGEGDNR